MRQVSRIVIAALSASTFVFGQSGDFATQGRVVTSGGQGVANATVTYTNLAKRLSWDFSDANGYFGGKTATAVGQAARPQTIRISQKGPLTIDIFDVCGKKVGTVHNDNIDKGTYALEPALSRLSQSLYVLKITAGAAVTYQTLVNTGMKNSSSPMRPAADGQMVLTKSLASVDTVRVGKTGYAPVKIPVTTYTDDIGNVTLTAVNIESEVSTLFGTMSQAEKVGQVVQLDFPGPSYAHDNVMGTVFGGGSDGPGNGAGNASQWASFSDGYQNAVVGSSGTAKKIPLLVGLDVVHGIGKCNGATILPHNIGLGCTWDPKIVQKVFRVSAIESRGCGINYAFGPCIAVPRDKRWGRVYEGFAETPDLTSSMCTAAVLGFQTWDLSYPLAVAACIKHFAGDGGTTFGTGTTGILDRGNTEGTDATLRAIHLPGYTAAVGAQAAAVMASFSQWNGTHMHENKTLLTDWLKTSQGFDGVVNGDWEGHITGTTGGNATAQTQSCINAGLDVPMGTVTTDLATLTGAFNGLYSNGSGARVDDAVKRLLRIKYRMGLFSNPVTTDSRVTALVGSQMHRDIAREAVRKSLVCLKNTNGVLPLAKTAKITLVGQHAQDIGLQCGGWTMGWQGAAGNITAGTTIRQGFESIGGTANISFSADGSSISGDVAVVCIGEQPYAEWLGDKTSLTVPNANYVTNAHNSGKKVVCVLISGRPMEISSIISDCDAFVCAWLPGSEGGGVAEVLYGNYDFTGKLSMTMPTGSSQYTLNSGDANYNPLFKYGFGLNLAGQQLPAGLYQ
jgi:beta-glucosidase-like glycosyl hydrolase